MNQDNLAALEQLSQQLWGDAMLLMVVEPSSLTLLKDNARYFKRETFRQLRDNIANDKKLSSVPLCYRHEDGRLEVLSGNHRVKASIEAGLPHILVLVITEELEKEKRIAIQLSHNSLVGEDDQSILAHLWAEMDSIEARLYSGLDSKTVGELTKDVELVNFTTPQVPAKTVTFLFTEAEEGELSMLMDMLEDAAKGSSRVYVSPDGGQYERFVQIIQEMKSREKIKDSSLAMHRVIEICREYLAKPQSTEATQ